MNKTLNIEMWSESITAKKPSNCSPALATTVPGDYTYYQSRL